MAEAEMKLDEDGGKGPTKEEGKKYRGNRPGLTAGSYLARCSGRWDGMTGMRELAIPL